MNLDDYSYEFEGRRYVNPQVSLDEQNAFINNLRDTQAQGAQEIEAQTYGLGTQVPSSQGGLAGGSGYFKARYQTPQVNQAVAELRSAAQSQALGQALGNELAKVQKRYKDAYRAASKRSSNSNNSDDTSLFDQKSGLDVNTDTTMPDKEKTISDQKNRGEPETAWISDAGEPLYTDKDGKTWYYADVPGGNLPWNSDLVHRDAKNGDVVTYGDTQYIYLKNDQYRDGRWFILDGRYFQ